MSLLPITVNSGVLTPQPTRVREYRAYQQSEKEAIDGSIQRNRIQTPRNPLGYKYIVEMAFQALSPSEFQAIDAYFVTGSGVNYYNANSKFGTLSFSGLPYVEDADDYAPGESLQSGLTVKIRQF